MRNRKFKTLAFGLILISFFLLGTFVGPKISDLENHINFIAFAADPAHVGQWSQLEQWPVKATHTTLLPNGKVIIWPSFGGGGTPYIWNPADNKIETGPEFGYNAFCAGHTLTADGKLFSAGGHVTSPVGLPYASFYDPVKNEWTRVKNMNNARWYPTVTSLASGNLLVIGGTIEDGKRNNVPQVYNIKTNKWRNLSNAKLRTSLYPFNYQTSKGKVFMAGNKEGSRYLKTGGTGAWGKKFVSKFGNRGAGTSVMFSDGKILIIGGGNGTKKNTKSVERIKLNSANPKWEYVTPMNSKRKHANSTLLPNGKVLVTGGSYGDAFDDDTKAVNFAEIYNPNTNKWKKRASNTVYRGYHSTAILLPDGRVLSAGGEKSGTSMEIYSPPYLFKGSRPKIDWAPKRVDYGQIFTINTPNIKGINKVRWIKLGSVTHSFNQSQRINTLKFVKKNGKLRVTVPSNKGKTPPGHYMLFILNGKGVPSIARIVKVGNININLPETLPPPPPPTGDFDPAAGHEEHEN